MSDAFKVIRKAEAGEMGARKALTEALQFTAWDGSEEDVVESHELLEDQVKDSHSPENGRSLEGVREKIQERLAELEQELAAANERFELLLDARRLALQMPPVDDLELYMRYETMLEYQMQRNLELLANVQRMRLLGPRRYGLIKALARQQSNGLSEEGGNTEG